MDMMGASHRAFQPLLKKYPNEIEKIVSVNSEIEARNATEGGRAKLGDGMEALLQEMLDSPALAVAAPPGQSAPVRKSNVSVTPPLKSGNKVAVAMDTTETRASAQGGAKLVDRLVTAVVDHDFTKRGCHVYS